MQDRSNVRCFLPKSEATKLLAFLLEVRRIWPEPYDATDDFARSIDEAYRVIRERMANGGPGWTPKWASANAAARWRTANGDGFGANEAMNAAGEQEKAG